jgi:hypothetical protein
MSFHRSRTLQARIRRRIAMQKVRSGTAVNLPHLDEGGADHVHPCLQEI